MLVTLLCYTVEWLGCFVVFFLLFSREHDRHGSGRDRDRERDRDRDRDRDHGRDKERGHSNSP